MMSVHSTARRSSTQTKHKRPRESNLLKNSMLRVPKESQSSPPLSRWVYFTQQNNATKIITPAIPANLTANSSSFQNFKRYRKNFQNFLKKLMSVHKKQI